MSGVTVDGVPFGQSRPWGDGTPTYDEINNWALAPKGRELGWCLCIHPMMQLIDFTGMTCAWCGQPTTKDAISEQAKTLRAEAILARYPELRKDDQT